MKSAIRLAAAALFAATLAAQLNGVIDIHVHSDPDSVPRSIDAIDAAKLAHARGERALVLKNHYEPTASLAYLVRKVVPGIELFGGIALNRTVGGVNPAAVERMTMVKGGWGRVVWMPTFDAENQVRYSKENRPFVSVSKDGHLLPEVNLVLFIIAKHKLTLATGHSSPQEDLMLIRAAKDIGVQRIVVTHAMLPPVKMSVAQMKQAAAMGAYLEFVYNALIGPNKVFEMPQYAAAIRAVGPEHCILSSDLGQAGNPLHPDGLEAFFRGLREQGFTVAEIDRCRRQPGKGTGVELADGSRHRNRAPQIARSPARRFCSLRRHVGAPRSGPLHWRQAILRRRSLVEGVALCRPLAVDGLWFLGSRGKGHGRLCGATWGSPSSNGKSSHPYRASRRLVGWPWRLMHRARVMRPKRCAR